MTDRKTRRENQHTEPDGSTGRWTQPSDFDANYPHGQGFITNPRVKGMAKTLIDVW